MIAELPKLVLYCLAATTLLGGVMGYCIAWLLAKKRMDAAVTQVQRQSLASESASETEIHASTLTIADLRQSLAQVKKQATVAAQREDALDVHAQLQAQRIQSLEAQVASYEDQQIRLQRDFANYKSNKSRELELARNKPDSWSEADQLPVLKKRIGAQNDEAAAQSGPAGSPAGVAVRGATAERSIRSGLATGTLSTPLTRELDIPSLAESELPDSVDELEFELAEPGADGAAERG